MNYHIKHRDEVEAPITDWLREAYELSDALPPNAGKTRAKSKHKPEVEPDALMKAVCNGWQR